MTISQHDGLNHVQKLISAATVSANRLPQSVSLIAVSKTFHSSDVAAVLNAGQRDFGENRVQEALQKWPEFRKTFGDIVLHLIGPLQSNKAREAVSLFDVIHTIDRQKIAEAIAIEMKKQNKKLKLFIQINTGREPQKAGLLPEAAPEFIGYCQNTLNLPIHGLMCIPPHDEKPEPHFIMLRQMAEDHGLHHLSMGMSSDFPSAIHEGATHIRVGSAIFGYRAPNAPLPAT